MRRVERAVHRDLESVTAAVGYPDVRVPHINLLAHVPRGEGIRMSVLADRMQLTPGAVTQLVSHLERVGVVRRFRDPTDGRAVIVVPTEAAERGYEACRTRLAEFEKKWRRLVGAKRWQVFHSVLEQIAASLEETP
jgi:DNA-binding MarR family transcriptional regulator